MSKNVKISYDKDGNRTETFTDVEIKTEVDVMGMMKKIQDLKEQLKRERDIVTLIYEGDDFESIEDFKDYLTSIDPMCHVEHRIWVDEIIRETKARRSEG